MYTEDAVQFIMYSPDSDFESDDEDIDHRSLELDEDEIAWERVAHMFCSITCDRSVEKLKQVDQCKSLAMLAATPAQKLAILARGVIKTQFSTNPDLTRCMPINVWKDCARNILVLLDILKQYPNIVLSTRHPGGLPLLSETKKGTHYPGKIRIWGCLLEYLVRMHLEFEFSLASMEPCTQEYAERLKDEAVLIVLHHSVMDHFLGRTKFKQAAKLADYLLRLVYYKPKEAYDALLHTIQHAPEDADILEPQGVDEGLVVQLEQPQRLLTPPLVPRRPAFPHSCGILVHNLVSLICEYMNEQTKARAILYKIYHCAVFDEFSSLRDLQLMSYLQVRVQHMNVTTQILFRTTMAQLGLCAFRAGLFKAAHSCLSQLYVGGQVKELLNQGPSSWHSRDDILTGQQNLDRRLQMPSHMHINLDLLEAVYLVSTMLLEAFNIAANTQGKGCSKAFSNLFETSQRKPSSNVLHNILSAAAALSKGNFQKSFNIVKSLDFWMLLGNRDCALEMVKTKMKEEALRTYLFTHSQSCDSAILDQITTMFDLPRPHLHRIVKKVL